MVYITPVLFRTPAFSSPLDFPRVEEHPEKGEWGIGDPKCDTEGRPEGGLGNYPLRVVKGKRKDGESSTERTSEKLPTKPGFVP